jgi:hypothetical protein
LVFRGTWLDRGKVKKIEVRRRSCLKRPESFIQTTIYMAGFYTCPPLVAAKKAALQLFGQSLLFF